MQILRNKDEPFDTPSTGDSLERPGEYRAMRAALQDKGALVIPDEHFGFMDPADLGKYLERLGWKSLNGPSGTADRVVSILRD